MDLREYVYMLGRRWRLIALVLLCILGINLIMTLRAEPVYRSQKRLFVSSRDLLRTDPLQDQHTYLIDDLDTTGSQTGYCLRTDYFEPYYSMFDGNFVFDDSVEYIWPKTVANLNRHGRQFAGGIEPASDRQTCAIDSSCDHIDAEGTRRYRRLWQLALASRSSWQTVNTRNDMVERTKVQATSNWNSTRADITAFYSAQLRHLPYPKPTAELYITTPHAIRIGETVKAEGLILNGSQRSVRFTTTLLDKVGRQVGAVQESIVAAGASGDASHPSLTKSYGCRRDAFSDRRHLPMTLRPAASCKL